jgi:cold shock CspA family protein
VVVQQCRAHGLVELAPGDKVGFDTEERRRDRDRGDFSIVQGKENVAFVYVGMAIGVVKG